LVGLAGLIQQGSPNRSETPMPYNAALLMKIFKAGWLFCSRLSLST
jgi:hypothetical protein